MPRTIRPKESPPPPTGRPPSPEDLARRRAALFPGPGEYSNLPAFGDGVPGGKIHGGSKPKTDTDWALLRAASLPPPGAYSNPKAMGIEAVSGGKFLPGPKPLTEEDFALKRAAESPGPGQYKLKPGVAEAISSKGFDGRYLNIVLDRSPCSEQ